MIKLKQVTFQQTKSSGTNKKWKYILLKFSFMCEMFKLSRFFSLESRKCVAMTSYSTTQTTLGGRLVCFKNETFLTTDDGVLWSLMQGGLKVRDQSGLEGGNLSKNQANKHNKK